MPCISSNDDFKKRLNWLGLRETIYLGSQLGTPLASIEFNNKPTSLQVVGSTGITILCYSFRLVSLLDYNIVTQ